MSSTLDLVKRAYRAWETKDEATLMEVLHPNYEGIMPGSPTIKGHEGVRNILKEMPDEFRTENEMFIEQGNSVVRIWDTIFTKPVNARLRMAELNVVEGDKIIRNEAFFDTGSMPKEMMEGQKKDAAA